MSWASKRVLKPTPTSTPLYIHLFSSFLTQLQAYKIIQKKKKKKKKKNLKKLY